MTEMPFMALEEGFSKQEVMLWACEWGFSQELCHSSEGETRPPLGHRQQKTHFKWLTFSPVCVSWAKPLEQESGCPSRRAAE